MTMQQARDADATPASPFLKRHTAVARTPRMPWFEKPPQRKKSIKGKLWSKCPKCAAHLFKEEILQNLSVCPKCQYHGKLTAQERIDLTLDPGSFSELFSTIAPADPLKFVDGKGSYATKVAEARTKTKLNESVVTGTGTVDGIPIVVAVMDFRFLGGSLGSGTGEKILLAANHAYDRGLPYIIFSASGGARMHEGTLSLMQMAKTCAGLARLHERGLPYISVLTDPTTGGVSASFAMVGDIHLAEPGALIGFAGRRVIEQTIQQKLPDDFQTSEYLLAHGFIDAIVNRRELKNAISTILSYAVPRTESAERPS
jgi:acetyl-CoA carboxylase carboxyl transferase subunit beta